MSFMAEVITIPSFICIICVACRRTLRRSAPSAPMAGRNAAPVCHGDRRYLFFERQQLKSKRRAKLARLVQHPKPSLESGVFAVEYTATAITSLFMIVLSFAFIFFSVRCGGWLKKAALLRLGKKRDLRRGAFKLRFEPEPSPHSKTGYNQASDEKSHPDHCLASHVVNP